jgi:hypothetical protein
MPKVRELLEQKRYDETWQKCCGILNLNIDQFMEIQKRLLLQQINMLNHSKIGQKVMRGSWPQTVEDFRRDVPLTTYEMYCPELSDKNEMALPSKPAQWVHTSGRSGEYSCKWVPMTKAFVDELGPLMCGIGIISGSRRWGDNTPLISRPGMIYSVAPRPYMSGALANILEDQIETRYYPSLKKAEDLSFEERIQLGFEEALSGRLDFFFGLSVVLTLIGDKFTQSNRHNSVKKYVKQPRALARLTAGLIKSKLEHRSLLPKDLWSPKGIITSGLDSSVFKEKIKEYWGRYPLDIYANTEGGIIATQTWDYEGMTFIPNLNFLEFIPEKEHLKWQLDKKYQPKTLLLDEVTPGECYEIVISNFHGGVMTRYRVGDIVRITALNNENTGIKLPQMVFERRADDLIDLVVIRLTEKNIWQAIEKTHVPYEGWVAFRPKGERAVNILFEPQNNYDVEAAELAWNIHNHIIKADDEAFGYSLSHKDEIMSAGIRTKVTLLPSGTFARYIAQRRAEGADIAHLKPPHVNPSPKILETLLKFAGNKVSEGERTSIRELPVSVG